MPIVKNHYRLSFSDAILVHDEVLAISGGRAGIISEHGIRSALDRPFSGYFHKIEDKGSALLEAIVQNHGFADGNKRTAVMLLLLFLERSGYALQPLQNEAALYKSLEDLVVELAAGTRTKEHVRIWLKQRCYRV